MGNNFSQFGDTYWIQLTGTAICTPHAPAYATLYFGIHELTFLPELTPSLSLYHHYNDDIFSSGSIALILVMMMAPGSVFNLQ